MKSKTMARRAAFTLIELLTVIAIIVVLAAILFPVFARARESARRASCASNMKQLALGILMYTQDYDEMLPMANTGAGAFIPNTWHKGWSQLVQPYVTSFQIFQCPSDPNPSTAPDNNNYGFTDYAMNTYVMIPGSGVSDGGGTYDGLSMTVLEVPSLSVLIYEMGNGHASNARSGCVEWDCSGAGDVAGAKAFLSGTTATAINAEIHLGGENYGFADGHVKWLKSRTKTEAADVYNGKTSTSTGHFTFAAN